MRLSPQNAQRIFTLNTEKEIREAERWKERLENAGYTVTVKTHGWNAVIIGGEPE